MLLSFVLSFYSIVFKLLLKQGIFILHFDYSVFKVLILFGNLSVISFILYINLFPINSQFLSYHFVKFVRVYTVQLFNISFTYIYIKNKDKKIFIYIKIFLY